MALGIASATTRAGSIAGMTCQPGTVAYLDAENGEAEIHRRTHGLAVVPERMVMVEVVAFDLRHHLDDLVAAIDDAAPSVLVLDSLRSLAPGWEENDSGSTEIVLRPVVRLAQERDLALLILHHSGKDGGDSYRGSSAIGSAIELGFTLRRYPDDPLEATRRRLTCWKSRLAPEPDPMWLNIDAGDGGVVIEACAAYEGAGQASNERLDE